MYNFINNMNLRTGNKKSINIPNNLVRGSQPEKLTLAKTFSLFSQPYLDRYNECYKNIVVINLIPEGPLANLVRFVKFPPLSEFKQNGNCRPLKQCGYALLSLNGICDDLMVVDEVPDLITYLVSNGYLVDTSITKMFNTSELRFETNTGNKLICFVTFIG